MITPSTYPEYVQVYERRMNHFVEEGFSFIIRDKMNRIVGVSCNHDVNGIVEYDGPESYLVVVEFLETMERPLM